MVSYNKLQRGKTVKFFKYVLYFNLICIPSISHVLRLTSEIISALPGNTKAVALLVNYCR